MCFMEFSFSSGVNMVLMVFMSSGEKYISLFRIQIMKYLSQYIPLIAELQSGASSRAKIGGAYFSDVTGSIQDPIAVPGPCEVT